jgi:hypothetical protein
VSYEGHVQVICEQGHFFEAPDPYHAGDPVCPHCKSPSAWINSVDDTNIDSNGVIPPAVMVGFIRQPAVPCTCTCGHKHNASETLFRIPSPEETRAARHYFDGEKYIPLNSPPKPRRHRRRNV